MSKTYIMPGDELTPEERERLRTFSEQQEQDLKEHQAKQTEREKTKTMVTLEQLLRTRIAPEEDRIVVWKDKVSSVTESGLLKPEEVKAKEERDVSMGTVLAVGPGKNSQASLTNRLLMTILSYQQTPIELSQAHSFTCRTLQEDIDHQDKISLQPGDHIIFGKFAGTPVQDPDTKEELLIMRPADIFGKIRPL